MVKSASYTIIWDKIALENLLEILNYLGKQSTQASKIVKAGILDRLDVIKSNPFITEFDKLKNPSNKNFRAFVIYNYRVTYQVKDIVASGADT